jgi:hypothetical protein
MELISDLHGNCEKERQAEQQSSSNRAAIEQQSVGMKKCLLASFQTGRQFII